jgi:hypothetical protein
MGAIDESEILDIQRAGKSRVSAARRSSSANPDLVWNVLTVLVWLGMASLVMVFISVYQNPDSRFNPFSSLQPTLVLAIVIPTETAQPERVDPTITPTASITPMPPTLTFTPSPTATDTPTPGPSPTATINSIYPFIMVNTPVAINGSAMPDHDTCMLWVAGQAYDLQNAPMVGVFVQLGGYINGKSLNVLSLTGTALQFGRAGYEFVIAEKPVRSRQSVWVQLLDQTRVPLSSKIYIDTDEDCQKNLILINFRQIR